MLSGIINNYGSILNYAIRNKSLLKIVNLFYYPLKLILWI